MADRSKPLSTVGPTLPPANPTKVQAPTQGISLNDDQQKQMLQLLNDTARNIESFTHQGQDPPPPDTWFGKVSSVLDRVWSDDFGATPIGSILGMGMNTLNWAMNRGSQATSWGLSALPGGTQTLDWDRAAQLSPGRVLTAMGVTEVDWKREQMRKAQYRSLVESGKPFEKMNDYEKDLWNEYVGRATPGGGKTLVPIGWNIAKPEDEQFLFGNTLSPEAAQGIAPASISALGVSPQATGLNIGSGAADAVATWYLDPMVLAGKAIKIARVGSEMLDIAGQTTRYTSYPQVQRQVAEDFDTALNYIQSEGAAGRRNWAVVEAENVAKRSGKQLQHEPWAQGEYGDQLVAIADKIDDPALAAVFLPAAAGSKTHIQRLFDEAPAVADALAGLRRENPYEFVAANAPIGSPRPVLLGEFLEEGADSQALIQDLIRRDSALQDALGLLGRAHSPIKQFGTRMVTGKEFAQAWRAGKAERATARAGQASDALRTADPWDEQQAVNELSAYAMNRIHTADDLGDLGHGGVTMLAQGQRLEEAKAGLLPLAEIGAPQRLREGPSGSIPGVSERVFQISKGFRKVAVWEWTSKQRGSGWITTKGADDGYGTDEWQAALTDSGVLRKDPNFIASLLDEWRATPLIERERKVSELEDRAVQRMAFEYGLTGREVEAARKAYAIADKRRQELLDMFRSNTEIAFGIDNGMPIVAGPILRSQLQSRVPIIDFRTMDNLLRDAAKPESKGIFAASVDLALQSIGKNRLWVDKRITEPVRHLADQILSAWKASVLIRLGYTIRNEAEGFLRTGAALGTIPALGPAAVARGTSRLFYKNAKAAGVRERADGAMNDLSRVIESTRRMHSLAAERAARYQKIVDDELALREAIHQRSLLDEVPADAADLPQPMSNARLGRYRSLLRSASADRDAMSAQIDDFMGTMDALSAERLANRKRFIGSEEAFSGERGEVAAARASNQITVENFFQSQASRDKELAGLIANTDRWEPIPYPALPDRVAKMRPDKFDAWLQTDAGKDWTKDSLQYWKALEHAAVQHRTDEFGRWVLNNSEDYDQVLKFWDTPAGKSYARDMGLVTAEDKARRSALLFREIHSYYPTERAIELARTEKTTAAQFRAELAGTGDLSTIHGAKLVADDQRLTEALQVRRRIFDWLANKPDSALVRQPYYNQVYVSERDRMWRAAIKNGWDENDTDLLRRIETTAHARALKSLESTIFTIQRYSNPAALMRFISPFFAAFENTIRTWGRLVVTDPSILPRANMLWNIPASMGMVVDADGKRVEPKMDNDFLKGSTDQFILLPEFLQDALTPLTGGVPFRFPRAAWNVVTPGEAPLLPGGGPLLTYPVGLVLGNRPDVSAWLHKQMGDALFSQIAPFGKISSDPVDAFASAWERKVIQVIQGEDSAQYLATWDAVTKDAYIDWVASGGNPEDKPDPQALKQNVNDFYLFSIASSLLSPVSITRMSRYQPQIDYWMSLQDEDIPYDQKYQKFIDKWGESYRGVVTSISDTGISGLDSTDQMFRAMNQYSDQVQMLNNTLGEGSASVLAATVPNGTYSPAVSDYWMATPEPGAHGVTFRRRLEGGELQSAMQVTAMWDEYNQQKDLMHEAMAAYGITSLNSAAARDLGIAEKWSNFQDYMAQKYGSDFTVRGPANFVDRMPQTLSAIQKLLDDKSFMDSDLGRGPVWQGLKEYMHQREMANEAIDAGYDKDAVSDQFSAWVNDWKKSSLQTWDFYDVYLDGDKLGLRVGG